jgi:prevent-host-death family protein
MIFAQNSPTSTLFLYLKSVSFLIHHSDIHKHSTALGTWGIDWNLKHLKFKFIFISVNLTGGDMIATAKSLRFHTGKILEATMRGENVTITYRGKPAAKIIPISKKDKTQETKPTHHLFGIWKDRNDVKDVDSHIRELRKGRTF